MPDVRMLRRRSVPLVVIVFAITIVFAFATGFWLLFRLAYVLLVAVPLAYLWARFNISALDVTVERLVDRAQVGQYAEERVTVVNRSLFPKLWIEVEDPSPLAQHSAGRVISLPAKSQRSWRVRTRLQRRGVYPIGPAVVTSGDPFGLFHITRSYGRPASIIVYPGFIDLPHFTVPPANLPGEGRFRKRTHYVTPNAAGVRDYEYGDSLSRIDWKSTARLSKLMVKVFELDPASDIWVVLDLQERIQAGEGEESTEEYGVKIAASVARHFLNANRNVGYMAFGARLDIIEAERGGQQMTHILESLALSRATSDVPIGDLVNVEGRRFGRHTTLVLVTSSTDQSWVMSLLTLTQRGVKVAVVLLEASTFGATNNSLMVVSSLAAADIWTYLVKRGDDLTNTLAQAGEPSLS